MEMKTPSDKTHDSRETISRLIDRIFSNKDEVKRKAWKVKFENEEFEFANELKGLEENSWTQLGLPMSVAHEIRNEIKSTFGSTKFELSPVEEIIQFEKSQAMEEDSTLTEKDKVEIIELLNLNLSPDKICSFLASNSTSKQICIRDFIQSLLRPPRELPINCQSLKVKQKGELLPIFQYPTKFDSLKKYITLLVIGETGVGS